MNDLAANCDDFHLSCYINTELEMTRDRDTILHFFEQVSKAYPRMVNFYGKDGNEYVLEEDKDEGNYRWMALEPRKIGSGFVNPEELEEASAQNELMLDLATHNLSVSSLDCEALDVVFGFDLNYRGNHDEVVAEVFAKDSRFGGLAGPPGAKVVDFEPTMVVALDEQCRLQARTSIITRTTSYQVRTGQYSEEPISVLFTIRKYWGLGCGKDFRVSYRKQLETGTDLLRQYVLPNVIIPLSEVISTR